MPRRSSCAWGIRVLEGLAALSLLVLMSIVLIDVVGRNVWNQPLRWATEVLEITLAVSIFLVLPVLAIRGGHVTVDLIELPSMARVQQILSGLVGAALFGAVTWALVRQTGRVAEFDEATPLLAIPLPLVFGSLAVLAGLTTLLSLLWSFLHLRWRGPGAGGGTPDLAPAMSVAGVPGDAAGGVPTPARGASGEQP